MNNYVNFTPFQYLIYYFAIILGLVPFTIKKNVIHPLGILRKFYAVFLSFLNAFVIFYSLNERSSRDIDVSTVNGFVITTLHTLHAVNLCSTILTFAFKTEKLIEIWKKITAISYEVKKLRIDDNNCGISWKKCSIKIIFTNCILIFMIIGIRIADNDYWPKISWYGFLIASIHRHNAIAIFSTTIICMGKLFESLNKKLQDAGQPNCSFPSSDDRVVTNRGFANSRAQRIITEPKGVQLCVEDLQKIGKSHEEICDLIESVTDCFTVPILFNIVQNFNNLLANCYSIYAHVFILRDIFDNTDATVSYIVSMMQWLVITLMESLLIAHACTSMSRAGNATKALLHEVWNKFYPEELRDELFMFSLQILHKPIVVSAYGFFDLGYSYIFKIFFAVVAYLTVMIQLDTSGHRNSGTSEEMRQ